jgi:hypothetical protein
MASGTRGAFGGGSRHGGGGGSSLARRGGVGAVGPAARADGGSERLPQLVNDGRGGGRLVDRAAASGGRRWHSQLIEPRLCIPSPKILHVQA